MNLHQKPLYALRNLGERLGVPAATKYKKNVLIEKIYKRVEEIEKGMPDPPRSVHGRPKLESCYIGIERDENGKVVFFDADAPEPKITAPFGTPEKAVPKSKKERESEIKRLIETKNHMLIQSLLMFMT